MASGFRIKLDDPGIVDGDERAATGVLRSGQLVCGPRVAELESGLAARTGRLHAVCVSSGTAALYLALDGLGIGPGSTVVVPALTFPAPAVAAAMLGAEVRLCDVDRETLNLSAANVEPVVDEQVSLVVAVDQFGNPAPVPELEHLLAPFGIPVLVDAACSLGSTLEGRPCGSLGLAAVLSFHPRKVITTGEGGAVLTDVSKLAERARIGRNIGMEGREWRSLGLNLRPSEIGAAIGASQLARLDETLERRRALAGRYLERLPLEFQQPLPGAETNRQTVAALLPEGFDGSARDALIRELAESGVEIGVPSYCVGALDWLAERLGVDTGSTPIALDVHERGVALPLHSGLGEDEVDEVIELVGGWLEANRGGR
jgi:dTDP-4-amino-4,6-dideoxygalactose transaminase